MGAPASTSFDVAPFFLTASCALCVGTEGRDFSHTGDQQGVKGARRVPPGCWAIREGARSEVSSGYTAASPLGTLGGFTSGVKGKEDRGGRGERGLIWACGLGSCAGHGRSGDSLAHALWPLRPRRDWRTGHIPEDIRRHLTNNFCQPGFLKPDGTLPYIVQYTPVPEC